LKNKKVLVKRIFHIFLLLLVGIPVFSWGQGKDRLVPVFKGSARKGFVFTGRYLRAPEDIKRRKVFSFDSPSKRALAKRRLKRGALKQSEYPDTIRVLLIRVSFKTDKEDELSSIYTGGDFDLSRNSDVLIDPPPHDKDYFNSHMIALRNFIHFQSCGKVELVWKILPEGNEDSYKLSDIADYGPGRNGYWTQSRLVRFFRDCVKAADDALARDGYPIHFSDFDAIVIAHAGADLQSDVNNDSPNDIPSYFALLGPEDEFTVDGGATVINEGSVIPEMGYQDGYYAGVSAVLAHEFGHQLGLCDMYNILNNSASVGVWDLMDSGGFLGAYIPDRNGKFRYVEGLLPSGFSAWPRYFLGWVEADTVTGFSEGIHLPAVEKCPARVVRVDIGNDEYFLIENRAAELDDYVTAFVSDSNGVVIGTGNCLNCTDTIPSEPIWELTNGYDILLPTESDIPSLTGGPGLLIWHIDDKLIRERWEDNVVNTYKPFGIALVEADGGFDLGDPYSRFGMGWYDDAFYEGNNTCLSDSTIPSAWSNWLVPSGVKIDGISARDTLMSFNAGVPGSHASSLLESSLGDAEIVSFINYEGTNSILVVDSYGRGWDGATGQLLFRMGAPPSGYPALADDFGGQGSAVVIADRLGVLHAFSTSTWHEYDGWPINVGGDVLSSPAVATTAGGQVVVVADGSKRIHVIEPAGGNIISNQIEFGDSLIGNLVISSDSLGVLKAIYCMSIENGNSPSAWIIRLDVSLSDGDFLQIDRTTVVQIGILEKEAGGDFYLLGGDILPDSPGDEIYVVSSKSGRIILVGEDGIRWIRDRGELVRSFPALGDVDSDGYIDLIISAGSKVFIVTPTGANSLGWPKDINNYSILSNPVRSHIQPLFLHDGSTKMVVVGTDEGLLFRMDSEGNLYNALPYRISSSLKPYMEIEEAFGDRLLTYTDGYRIKWRDIGIGRMKEMSSWYTVLGNLKRSAFIHSSQEEVVVEREWADLESNFIIYPNPSNGSEVKFHFPAPPGGLARLRILDVSGELLISREKRVSGDEDEFALNLSDKASGIYICILELVDGRGKRVKSIKKFAIVK